MLGALLGASSSVRHMSTREHVDTVYVMRWDDGLVKVGYSSHKRWRHWERLGGRVLATYQFLHYSNAFDAEEQAQSIAYPYAFDTQAEARERFGASYAGGFTEFRRVPVDVSDDDLIVEIEALMQQPVTHA
jgi:hypothetical protein